MSRGITWNNTAYLIELEMIYIYIYLCVCVCVMNRICLKRFSYIKKKKKLNCGGRGERRKKCL
jgi:hypothetical protein